MLGKIHTFPPTRSHPNSDDELLTVVTCQEQLSPTVDCMNTAVFPVHHCCSAHATDCLSVRASVSWQAHSHAKSFARQGVCDVLYRLAEHKAICKGDFICAPSLLVELIHAMPSHDNASHTDSNISTFESWSITTKRPVLDHDNLANGLAHGRCLL